MIDRINNFIKEVTSRFSKSFKKANDIFVIHRDTVGVWCGRLGMLCLIMALFVVFGMRKDIGATSDTYAAMQKSINMIGNEYRSTLVIDGYKRAELHSRALRDKITKTIEHKYAGNMDALRSDLQGYIAQNDINNGLYKIFHEEVFSYVDHWFKDRIDVRVIVADKRKILFSSTVTEPFRRQERVPAMIFNYPTNEVLSCMGDDPESLKSLEIEELIKDHDRIENLVLIAPSYIYEHKDLLGVGDVYPDGTPIDNDKLAVVIAFKPITKTHISVMHNISTELENNKINGYATVVNNGVRDIVLFMLLAVTSGALWYLVELSKRKDEADDEQ